MQSLNSWIEAQLKRGYSRKQIKNALIRKGYSPKAVAEVDRIAKLNKRILSLSTIQIIFLIISVVIAIGIAVYFTGYKEKEEISQEIETPPPPEPEIDQTPEPEIEFFGFGEGGYSNETTESASSSITGSFISSPIDGTTPKLGAYHDLKAGSPPTIVSKSSFDLINYPLGSWSNPADYATSIGESKDQSRSEMAAVLVVFNRLSQGGSVTIAFYNPSGDVIRIYTWQIPDPKAQSWCPSGYTCWWNQYTIAIWGVGHFKGRVDKPGTYKAEIITPWGSETLPFTVTDSNKPPLAVSISASPGPYYVNNLITVTVSAGDDAGINYLSLWDSDVRSWQRQYCSGYPLICHKSWTITPATSGTKSYYGWADDSGGKGSRASPNPLTLTIQAPCTNKCSPNSFRCSGDYSQKCVIQSNGCYDWGSDFNCNSYDQCAGQACTRLDYFCNSQTGICDSRNVADDSCTSQCASGQCLGGSCVPPCTNECSFAGEKRCSGSFSQTCGNYDSDACLEWDAGSNCEFTPFCSSSAACKELYGFCDSSGYCSSDFRANVNCPNQGGAACSGTCRSDGVCITDTTPPTGSVLINGGDATTSSASVTLSLSCSDASGCSQMKISNSILNLDSAPAEAFVATKPWTLTSGDGTKAVYVIYRDSIGNWMPVSSVVSDTITISSPPSIPSSPSPSNSAIDVSTSPTLSWSNTVSSGGWYFAYHKKSTDTAYTPSPQLTTNSFSLSGLSLSTTYNWNVRACNPGPVCTDSDTWSFTTQACTGSIDFTIDPSSIAPNGQVSFISSGLSGCNGKTVKFVDIIDPSYVVLSTKATCQSESTGCIAQFTAPSSEGNSFYYATIDKDGNGKIDGAGEISPQRTLSVQKCLTTPPKSYPPISLANGCAITIYAKGKDGHGSTIVGEGKYKDVLDGAASISVNYDDYKNNCDVDFKFKDSWSTSGNSLTIRAEKTWAKARSCPWYNPFCSKRDSNIDYGYRATASGNCRFLDWKTVSTGDGWYPSVQGLGTNSIELLQIELSSHAEHSYTVGECSQNSDCSANYACHTNSMCTIINPPVLVSPADGSTAATLMPTISWNNFDYRTLYYKYYIRTFSQTPDTAAVKGTATHPNLDYTIPSGKLSDKTTYYWSVKECTDNAFTKCSNYAIERSFTTPTACSSCSSPKSLGTLSNYGDSISATTCAISSTAQDDIFKFTVNKPGNVAVKLTSATAQIGVDGVVKKGTDYCSPPILCNTGATSSLNPTVSCNFHTSQTGEYGVVATWWSGSGTADVTVSVTECDSTKNFIDGSNSQCPVLVGKPYCSPSNTCVECASDANCGFTAGNIKRLCDCPLAGCTAQDIPGEYVCTDPITCDNNEQCKNNFCCESEINKDANNNGKIGDCVSTGSTAQPYLCT